MQHINISDKGIGFKASVSVFLNKECHIMIEPTDPKTDAVSCISSLKEGLEKLLFMRELNGFRPIFRRWFLSDIYAQKNIAGSADDVPTSFIQQPPMNGSKAVLWVWLMNDVSDSYGYIFKGDMTSDADGSYLQMREILNGYSEDLSKAGMTVAQNCVRTWIYVRDVDVNYSGIVKARRELFDSWGLTSDTHYLASTGINGIGETPSHLVCMDAYSVKGLKPDDIRYLHALENLSPTHVYGVTFERGTALHFEDRIQILISGTASIDKNGVIVAEGDICRQTERTFENIQALLAEAGAGFKDMAQMIVYIRDTADYEIVKEYIENNLPDIPKVITLAPVCRPGWLVEVECIALVPSKTAIL